MLLFIYILFPFLLSGDAKIPPSDPVLLSWEDHFKGKPDLNSPFKALTFLEFKYGYRAEILNGKIKLTFNFESNIDREKSWHKLAEIPTEQQRNQLLRHEQMHVNIHFLMSKEMAYLIPNKKYSIQNYKTEIKKNVDQIKEKYHEIQQRYDAQTNHGRILSAQEKWDQKIDAALLDQNPISHL